MQRLITIFLVLAVATAGAAETRSQASTDVRDACFATIKSFYFWVLKNGEAADALQPEIEDVKGTTHFRLNLDTLPQFSAAFMQSGLFTREFPRKVEKYYTTYRDEFSAIPQDEFDQIARDGRGPMMETEDMDIFFCAQEYEYKQDFVDRFRIASFRSHDDTATMTVESPYGWKTDFDLTHEGSRWLISGYCVFR
jgi:hypothetical protein